MDPTKPTGIRISQVFLLEARFAHRTDALSLPHTTPHPEGLVNCQVRLYEGADPSTAAAGVRIQTAEEDQKALYRYSVEMVAVVTAVPGEENLPPSEYIRGPAIATLVPFIREAVANLTMRGRFGPVWLNPMNIQQVLLNLVEQAVPAVPERSSSAKRQSKTQASGKSRRARSRRAKKQ
jgi:hypothetical protein